VLRADARGLADYRAPDALDDLGRRALPPRAVLLMRDAGSWFRHLGSEAEEQLRADITVVPLDFLGYPKQVERLRDTWPELGPLLAALETQRHLPVKELRALAARRPVYVELDDEVGPLLARAVESDGLFERVRSSALPVADSLSPLPEAIRFGHFYTQLKGGATSPELAARLARLHRRKAVALATAGLRERALLHVKLGLASEPRNQSMLRLGAALATARALPKRWPDEAP
jgi:hypothetical protein